MKKLLVLFLALALTVSLCAPASATDWDAYWEGYDLGWEEGYAAGEADFEAGLDPAVANYDDGYSEGYISGYEAGYSNAEFEAEWGPDSYIEPAPLDVIAEYGGVPGAFNVMINGACIDFQGVRPENRDGRVMVPVRAILEALGAVVEYDLTTKTVTATREETVLVHVIGTQTAEVYAGGDLSGEPEIIVMDCASYITGGRTMVPVRFLSEALGYIVNWDPYYKTVVILDTEALEEEYDFSILNLLLSDAQRQLEEGKTYRQDVDMALELTLLDSLNGGKTMNAAAEGTALVSGEAMDASLKLDFSEIIALMEEEFYYMDEAEMALIRQLLELEAEVIYDLETDIYYIKSPLFDEIIGKSTWVELDLASLIGLEDPTDLLALLGADADMLGDGALTMVDLVMLMTYSSDAIFLYEELTTTLVQIEQILGDENFRKSGDTYTLDMDLLTLAGMLGEDPLWYFNELPRFDLTLVVTDTGDGTCDYSLDFYLRTPELEIDASLSSKGENVALDVYFHVTNTVEGAFTMDAVTRETNETPRREPPVSEEIASIEDLEAYDYTPA